MEISKLKKWEKFIQKLVKFANKRQQDRERSPAEPGWLVNVRSIIPKDETQSEINPVERIGATKEEVNLSRDLANLTSEIARGGKRRPQERMRKQHERDKKLAESKTKIIEVEDIPGKRPARMKHSYMHELLEKELDESEDDSSATEARKRKKLIQAKYRFKHPQKPK